MKNNNLNKEAAQTEKVYLKADKFKELANELSKIKTDIQLMRSMSETFPSMDRIPEGELVFRYYKAHQYFGLLFSKFEDMEKDIDDIASVLYAVTELDDLKEIVDSKDIDKK